jgi:hypothetical protein
VTDQVGVNGNERLASGLLVPFFTPKDMQRATIPIRIVEIGESASGVAAPATGQAQLTDLPSTAPPAGVLGRWMRGLIGVDEPLLSIVWEKRSYYTLLASVVLGTATLAAFSMADAVNQAVGPPWPVLVVAGLLWGTFISFIDRWLIVSTHGSRTARWRIFVPRIVLSLLFGVIVSAPLVLTAFGSEIVAQAATDQQDTLTSYESLLNHCNPLPNLVTGTVPPVPAGCGRNHLPVSDPAVGLTQVLSREGRRATELSREINTATQTISQDARTVQDEETGTKGPGLSGSAGCGSVCQTDMQAENQYKADHPVQQWQNRLTALNNLMQSQSVSLGNELQDYSTNISRAVSAQVVVKQGNQGRIGLLNRIQALGELARVHPVIAAAAVLLGLFVLVIDCMPVLVKIMSGTTSYDRLVETRLVSAEVIAAAAIRANERRAVGADEVALHATDLRIRAEKEQIDRVNRAERGRRNAQVDREIAELTEEIMRKHKP